MNRPETVLVFEVLVDLATISANTGDHMETFRFGSKGAAQDFARGRTCWGSPATVTEAQVSRKLARRWGVA